MTKEDLYPKLLNKVTLSLEDGTELSYLVSDEPLNEIFAILGKWRSYVPIGAVQHEKSKR